MTGRSRMSLVAEAAADKVAMDKAAMVDKAAVDKAPAALATTVAMAAMAAAVLATRPAEPAMQRTNMVGRGRCVWRLWPNATRTR